MKEEKIILDDTAKTVGEPVSAKKTEACAVDSTDAATESKSDPTAKLREAGDTITRAEADAESFKRRREKNEAPDVSDEDKKREEERKRIEEEAKKRESTAEEKRAALEYAESYRDRIRNERESAAAKKKEEDKERARAEEKMARERELSEGIEREREAAKERGARAESLLEKVSGDVSAVAKREATIEVPAAEEVPVTEEKVEAIVEPDVSCDTAADEKTADVTDTKEGGVSESSATEEPAATEKTEEDATAVKEEAGTDSLVEKEPTEEETEDTSEKTEDTSSTEEKDEFHIIHIGSDPIHGVTVIPAVSVGVVADASKGDGTAVKSADKPIPPSELSAYSDFDAPVTVRDIAPSPAKSGEVERKYEEESDLIRHSMELEEEERARKIAPIVVYPDPEPDMPERKTGKTKGDIAEEHRAMLEFERGYGRGSTPEKIDTDPYAGVGASALADEIARGDVSSATDSTVKPDAPVTLKAKPVFDKKSLKKSKAKQVKNDNKVIEQRIRNNSRKLEMEALIAELSFDAKGDDGRTRRAKNKIKEQIAGTKKQIKEALKYENEDNARYYHLVLTDVETAKLPKKTDRDYVRETRNEILALLKKRDEINIKLSELYSLSSGGKIAEGRHRAIQRGMIATHKKLRPIYDKCEKAKVSVADKEKLYALLNERVSLGGELAKVNYLIKKENLNADAKKQAKRDRSKIQRKLNENRREIARFEKKAVVRAEKKNERKRVSFIGWTVLLAIVVAGVLIYLNFDQILEWAKGMFPGLLGG